MNSAAYVELALKLLSGSQKDLATRLGVSPTQISKWKKGEYMSTDMETKISKMLKIGNEHPEFILMAGSVENSKKWGRLIHYLAEDALESAETGYDTYPLQDEMELLNLETFSTLSDMGIALPAVFPSELDFDYDTYCDCDDDDEADKRREKMWALLRGNSYSSIIINIFRSLTNVYGFYAAHVEAQMSDESLDLIDTDACNIEPCLMRLAACKIEVDEAFAEAFPKFKRKTQREFTEWINIVKDRAFRARVPLTAELLDLVYQDEEALCNDAEAESLGFNRTRLHPDIYMNELLCGMRVIHQVLPAIMKKLGIDEEEFTLDESELRIGGK